MIEEERQAAAEVLDATASLSSTVEPPVARGGLAWLREGGRALVLRAPRLEGLDAGPLTLAALVLAGHLMVLTLQLALAPGPVFFLWTGFVGGWAAIAIHVWLCWIVARSGALAHKPAALFALSCGMWLEAGLCAGCALIALDGAFGPMDGWPTGWFWAGKLLPLAWVGLAQIVLLWRAAGSPLARATAMLLAPVPLVLGAWLAPASFWWNLPDKAEPDVEPGLPLTDEIVSGQPRLLHDALQALKPPQPGRVNVYGLTYAPYASEDVFMRESAVAARTMRERFGAQMVELVVNPATTATLPWATPMNLRKAIAQLAATMDRDRDVLFLHLTSHGGADGRLAVDTWPLQTEPVTPELLKQWLDEAGVRWRVISVSACYSGSWIAPLAGDGTLVMTAADADHSSYGCGKRSELTFFGRAMYEEALRKTWSFTEAHVYARKVIEVREQEAGKSDGYSNPQIGEGEGVRAVLARLATTLQGDARADEPSSPSRK